MFPLESTPARAFRSFVLAAVAIAVVGLLALAAQTPFLFPSLGATAFILIMAPTTAPASARNAVGAHVIGAAAGCASFHLFALDRTSATLANGGGVEHVAACALALAVTCGAMALARLAHPPAGATTLICALGFLPQWWHVPMVAASVVLLTLTIRGLQRASGARHPWWNEASEPVVMPAADAELEPGD
jgi:CBS-domain-containing membrane protein